MTVPFFNSSGGPSGRRVLLALSGGVDSAVAALLLKERGFEVTAARMRVYSGPEEGLAPGCYGSGGRAETQSAAAAAAQLGLNFVEIDCSEAFSSLVLDYFRCGYLAGLTPNPCVRCNETIKFGLFPQLARRQGLDFDFFATGHYVRLARWPQGNLTLRRGADMAKDQSYFLYRLPPKLLPRLIFPLGDLTKTQVRALAAERRLIVHGKADSQDFYGGAYGELLAQSSRPGSIVDSQGQVLGRHQGYWNYTPGQRRGLGVAAREPLYVLKIIPERNEVVVGPASENSYDGCRLHDCRWLGPPPAPGSHLLARLRSSQPLRPVTVGSWEDGSLQVFFDQPQSGLAPGQSLVFYDGDLVLGGGIFMAV